MLLHNNNNNHSMIFKWLSHLKIYFKDMLYYIIIIGVATNY